MASILAYNQNEFATMLCNIFENKDSDITYFYFEIIVYTMHDNLLRRCAYHRNILRRRNADDGRTLMFLSSHKMSKKSDGRTNFQNAKFLFRKSQVNINNNKNWKHSTQMRIMHVCWRFLSLLLSIDYWFRSFPISLSLSFSLSLNIYLFSNYPVSTFLKQFLLVYFLNTAPYIQAENVQYIPFMLCFVDPIQK